ncbi:hypothetical protein [Luteolibacter sp.]|uniref:hypothetical protein n=1 Tax=Luteolibacter sp. TaxID=1962973 RepID=UPI003264CBA2
MKITKVCCQGCGADLQIDESIRFVTCNYCNARLEVVHDSTVTHTRQLDKIEKTTDQLVNKVKVLELQNDLERLDREWDNRRETLLVRNKHGNVSEPSSAGSMIGGMIAIVFGIFWISMAASIGAPGFFPLFGLVFIGVAVFNMVNGTAKAGAYRNHQSDYESRRQQLIDRIERERNS